MADVPIRTVITLPPEDTVRAFDAREELRTTVKWSEMLHDEHNRAFTVAKVAKLDLLEDIRSSLADVIHNGGTFEQWQAGLVPTLEKAGWWGRVEDRELTGTSQPVFVGPRRLRTIYQTNLRMSRAAGQCARIQESKKVSPYLRYSAVMDGRTRPLHRQWHGTILPVDHEWWDTHFPPCGWNCRCTVQQLSERDLRNNGWSVSQPPADGDPKPWWPAGADKPVMVPAGIDPGFAYHPGKASFAPIADKAVRSLERAAVHDLAAARAVLRDPVDSPAFLKAMDEPEVAWPVMILDDELRVAIGAKARVAVLSSDTYGKQLGQTSRSRGHGELTIADYRALPDIGAAPDLVLKDRDRHLVFYRAGSRLLHAVVKSTHSGQALFVDSLRLTNRDDVRRKARGADVVLGDLAAFLAQLIGGGR